ncbi:MAG: HEAT repeat domain-containing protein [Pyrinomonadaceae bacterium]
MNQQIKAGLSAMKDFLAGRSNDDKVVVPEDKATREVVAAELLAAMSGGSTDEAAPANSENAPSDTPEIPRFVPRAAVAPDTNEPQAQERARQLFLDHGYFDEAVQKLRAASAPAERAAAARALGVVGSQRATAHLIAAMFDDDAEVRDAAAQALIQVGEPVVDDVSATAVAADEIKKVDEATSIASSVKGEEVLVGHGIEAAATNVEAAEVLPEPVEVATAQAVSAQNESSTEQTVITPATSPDLIAVDSAGSEQDPLLREEQTILETVADVEQLQLAAANAFKELENEVRWRTEREAKVRAEATARRLEEEDLRKRTEEEAEVRRRREREAVAVERAARLNAEAEAQRHADEETNLRMKAASLRLEAAALARRRADIETARQEAAEAARLAEVVRTRDDARSRHDAELGRLASEKETLQTATGEVLLQQTKVRTAHEQAASEIEKLRQEQAAVETAQRAEAERLRHEAHAANSEAQEQLNQELERLRQVGEEVARRHKEVEAARERADEEEQRLLETQARIQAAEEARAQTAMESSQIEAEINQQAEEQLRLLEETRRRREQEQARLQYEVRVRAEKEQQHLAELEVMKTSAEVESKGLAEKERHILGEIDSLRIADADTRRRIEDAEARRRAAADASRLIAERVQRVEAEAHARAKEEARMLAKLEAERRNAAIDAQSRAEQEKRIREEIEMFRRLEEEERPRVEEATLQLADAESRLQERKDRLKEEVETRVVAEEEFITVGEQRASTVETSAATHWQDKATETSAAVPRDETPRPVVGSWSAADVADSAVDANSDETGASAVTPAIATYLNSVDPYKRAAAVAELARSGSPDAFSRIAVCFDDPSPHVRNAAARALRKLEPDRTVDLFNRALEEASADRRRKIGAAIAASGLATDAINNLASASREDTYNALSILFVMAKTGEVEPLVDALKEHGDDEIGKAVSKLLTLSGHRVGEQAGEQAAGADGRGL